MTKQTNPSSATTPSFATTSTPDVAAATSTVTATTATPTPPILELKPDGTLSQSADQPYDDCYYVWQLPIEVQVHWLTFLRAYDLAALHQTCRYYHNPALVHAIVQHTAHHVYPISLTRGFEQEPVTTSTNSSSSTVETTRDRIKKTTPPSLNDNKDKTTSAPLQAEEQSQVQQQEQQPLYYTFEHLRNMELLVIARVLSQPEPATGYVVSKSWCKTALSWLAARQEQQQQQLASHFSNNNKKKKVLSKKKQRLRQRRLSDASPPWPDANSDLLCPHNALQHCTSSKTARARRKVLDKHAWKILKKLFPESTPLESECVQCVAEKEIARLSEQKLQLERKLERKQPLADPVLRRFYTRTKGVPEQALQEHATAALVHATRASEQCDGNNRVNPDNRGDAGQDRKLAARPTKSSGCDCPLKPGTYYILPRKWCYGWRRYMRTGEGGISSTLSTSSTGTATTRAYPAPDAASLLCDAHRMVLLPPHLEAYLYGKQAQLLSSSAETTVLSSPPPAATVAAAAANSHPPPAPARRLIPGQAVAADPETMQALLAAGLSAAEVRQQLSAMQQQEQEAQQEQQQQYLYSPAASSRLSNLTNNERLDRENHSVVEIVTLEEFQALERLWDKQPIFGVSFDVVPCARGGGSLVQHHMPACRACDATGLAVNCRLSSRSRSLSESSHHHHHHHHSSSSSPAPSNAGNTKMPSRPPLEY